jgi:hypothetical protein
MKTTLILIAALILIILLMAFLTSYGSKTETQKYKTMHKKGDFEIRFYPEAHLASVSMNGNYDNMRNSGFRVLAGYIFGNNKENKKIAMTSPVRMTSKEGNNTMSFVMPSKMDSGNLPEPVNTNIVLHKSKPVFAASIRYGGFTNNKEIERNKAKLMRILEDLDIEHSGNFEYLGYNPPYQVFNRRNEILVELVNFDSDEFNEKLAKK